MRWLFYVKDHPVLNIFHLQLFNFYCKYKQIFHVGSLDLHLHLKVDFLLEYYNLCLCKEAISGLFIKLLDLWLMKMIKKWGHKQHAQERAYLHLNEKAASVIQSRARSILSALIASIDYQRRANLGKCVKFQLLHRTEGVKSEPVLKTH